MTTTAPFLQLGEFARYGLELDVFADSYGLRDNQHVVSELRFYQDADPGVMI